MKRRLPKPWNQFFLNYVPCMVCGHWRHISLLYIKVSLLQVVTADWIKPSLVALRIRPSEERTLLWKQCAPFSLTSPQMGRFCIAGLTPPCWLLAFLMRNNGENLTIIKFYPWWSFSLFSRPQRLTEECSNQENLGSFHYIPSPPRVNDRSRLRWLLTFEYVVKILWSYHSNETSLAVYSHVTSVSVL